MLPLEEGGEEVRGQAPADSLLRPKSKAVKPRRPPASVAGAGVGAGHLQVDEEGGEGEDDFNESLPLLKLHSCFAIVLAMLILI